jgi:integrase
MRDVIAGQTAVDVRTKARGRAIVKGGKGTATRTMALLSTILTYAVQEGYRTENPARGIVLPAYEKRKVHLTPEQYRSLGRCLAAAEARGEPWQAVEAIRLLALTGCRASEVTTLPPSEFDLRGACLRLGDTKTGASVRPLGRPAIEVLKAAIARSQGRYVFPAVRGKKGGPFQGLPRAWERIIGDALPGLSPHGLRHAFASMAEELGFTIPTIKALLGHAGSGVTEGYIHKLDSALSAAADRVSQHIAEAMGDGRSLAA